MPSIALAGDGPHAEMFAAAAWSLRWEVRPEPDRADVVLVDGAAEHRGAATAALLAEGADVIMAPGLDVGAMAAVADAAASAPGVLVIGEPFPTAPAVQRWFSELTRIGDVDHLSGRAARTARRVDLDWSLLAVTMLSARLAGWGAPTGVERAGGADLADVVRFESGARARLTIDSPGEHRPPHWELQAASATGALRVEMLPRPVLERDGGGVPLSPAPDPADAFGVAPLLRTFRADLEAGRPPVLDARFGLAVERLREQLSRA